MLDYFELGLDFTRFIRCWSVARKLYHQKSPTIAKLLDIAARRFEQLGEKTDLKRVFEDLISAGKPDEILERIRRSVYAPRLRR
jgi:hypothetical protein